MMESEKNIQREILDITQEIQEKHPELLKYINEMQDTLPEKGKASLDLKSLQEYRDSLRAMLNKYTETNK